MIVKVYILLKQDECSCVLCP